MEASQSLAFKEFDVKKCNVLYSTKKNLKDMAKFKEFVTKMQTLLKSIDRDELKKYDENLVEFVCETVEHVFTQRGCGTLKQEISVEILKPFFDDNVELVAKFIELMLPKIVRSTKYTRVKSAVYNFFLRLCRMVAGK